MIRDTGLPGTDPSQTAYVLECEQCQHRYATNGSDILGRRCPRCQSGKPAVRIAPGELLQD